MKSYIFVVNNIFREKIFSNREIFFWRELLPTKILFVANKLISDEKFGFHRKFIFSFKLLATKINY